VGRKWINPDEIGKIGPADAKLTETVPLSESAFAVPVVDSRRGVLNWRYVGKMDSRRALFTSGTGLIFFDLRAAAIRVHYENLLGEMEHPRQQRLLMPIALDLRRQELEHLGDKLAELERIGFSVQETAPQQFTVSALPLWLREHDGEAFLYDWLVFQDRRPGALQMEFLAEIAARHIAGSRPPTTEDEILQLLGALMACRFPATGPDGSAIYFEVPNGEIERRWAQTAMFSVATDRGGHGKNPCP
jgi:DNA mismatch repair ATPase MutL